MKDHDPASVSSAAPTPARPSDFSVTGAVDAQGPPAAPTESDLLRPYVPRLVIDWLRHCPDARHRALEGTLVFVDISGFTALTELLSKRGKIGAEVMRDTLDGVFRALLDEAYDWGAGLLKWGGDALLLLFDGPGHPERACRAAWELQRTIARVGRLRISGRSVQLRMSVGIGTGTFHFFMVGSVHSELLIAGPAMTETLIVEGIADAGEIGLTPALAARLDPGLVGPRKEAALLLAGPPPAVRERALDVGDVSTLDIASSIPVAARAHVLLRRSEPEHRTITAAFIDLLDTDRLLAEVGAERLAEALHDRMRSIQEAALKYDVPFYETDVGKSSVKALLTAGAPSSTGHDEEQVLRALREVMDQPGLVPVRVGVNTGKVFTGDFGPPYRRAYRVFGDAINTAARVMAKAEPGQILATSVVVDRSRTLFETTPIEPFRAKGKAALVHALAIGPATGLRESRRRNLPLIGRDVQLDAVLHAVEGARTAVPGVVEIVGESGLGKTRLLEEVAARAADCRVLIARCEEYEASTAYRALRGVFREIIGVDATAGAAVVAAQLEDVATRTNPTFLPWLPLLGVLVDADVPPTPETLALEQRFVPERVAELAAQLIADATRGSPLILMVDDADHLDDASRDLLARLRANPAHDRQLLLIASETGPVLVASDGEEPGVLVPMPPLPADSLVRIVHAATDEAPLHPHHVDAVVARSSGNPMFLLELVDAVRASGSTDALPDSIEALAAASIDRLAPADRLVVRHAAVLGTAFREDLLATVLGEEADLDEDISSRLGGVIDRDADGTLRFRSTLLRDTAYEGLPYRQRRALHGRVGETLERGAAGDEALALLALHFDEAQRWDRSWLYNRRAGDRAMAMYANVDAVRFFHRALGAGRHLPGVGGAQLAELYELSSDALYRLGEFTAADRALRAARRLLGRDPVHAARIAVKQAMLSSRMGRNTQALGRLARALHTLDGTRGAEAAAARARLMRTYGAVRYFQNRPGEAIAWARRAAAIARRARAREVLALCYQTLDLAYAEAGQLDKARYSHLALEIFEELGDIRNQASTLNNLGLLAHARSEWELSRELYERAIALFEKIGDREKVSLGRFNVAEILVDQGHYDEAEVMLRDVMRTWRSSGALLDVASAKAELGKLLARRGEHEAAERQLREARGELLAGGAHGEVLMTDVKLAELQVLGRRSDEALQLTERLLAVAAGVEGGAATLSSLRRLRGLALLHAGRLDEAAVALGMALASARQHRDRYQEALTSAAQVDLATVKGVPDPAAVDRMRALLAQLRIVALPGSATSTPQPGRD